MVGVRPNYVAASYAAPIMIAQGSGLIVNVSFYAARRYCGNVAYGAAKAATDAMSRDMAHELKPHRVAVMSLYPGHVIDRKKGTMPERETAHFVGRAVAALAVEPDVMTRSGMIQQAALLARDHGFTDIDGTQPEPLGTL